MICLCYLVGVFRGYEDQAIHLPLVSQVNVTVFAAASYRLVMRTKTTNTAARQFALEDAVKLLLRSLPLVLFLCRSQV